MIVRFSIIASSSRPSLPYLRKNGIAKSYVLIQKNEKSVEKERGRGRERRRLRLSVKYTLAFASIALSEELPMDDDLRRFWCVIPMADIELLPARTHQRSNVRRSQPIWRSPKRRTTQFNEHVTHKRAYDHTNTRTYKIYTYRRHAHTYSRWRNARTLV